MNTQLQVLTTIRPKTDKLRTFHKTASHPLPQKYTPPPPSFSLLLWITLWSTKHTQHQITWSSKSNPISKDYADHSKIDVDVDIDNVEWNENPQEKDYCEIENESDGVNVSNISNVSDKNEFEHE